MTYVQLAGSRAVTANKGLTNIGLHFTMPVVCARITLIGGAARTENSGGFANAVRALMRWEMKRNLLFNITAVMICAGMLAGCGGADAAATDKGGETLDIESITAGSTSEASKDQVSGGAAETSQEKGTDGTSGTSQGQAGTDDTSVSGAASKDALTESTAPLGTHDMAEEINAVSSGEISSDNTFDLTMKPKDSIGDVRFTSYLPDAVKNKNGDAVFKISRGDTIITVLDGMETGNIRKGLVFEEIAAVAFPDIDGDGKSDIITICGYKDEKTSKEVSEPRIYYGNGDGTFKLDKETSKEAQSALTKVTVPLVLGFLGVKDPQYLKPKTVAKSLQSSAKDNTGWSKALEDDIKNDKDKDDYDWYALIYIDDDDIPEVVKESKYEADGNKIVTYDKESGKVTDNQLCRLGFYYAEGKNILVNSDGNMDEYFDTVYAVKNGVLVKTAGGTYGAPDNSNLHTDADGNLIYEYNWNGKKMTKDEYDKEFAAATDNQTLELVYDYQQLSYDEIIAKLEKAST